MDELDIPQELKKKGGILIWAPFLLANGLKWWGKRQGISIAQRMEHKPRDYVSTRLLNKQIITLKKNNIAKNRKYYRFGWFSVL